ncbi:MAG TPA: hypothetical protein VM142_03600 [Acidimicrobiales bacterium]|nr:hypothetical protein [Acidimicrobiales bacterium]
MTMTPTLEDRDEAVQAFGTYLGEGPAATFDELLPRRPWRERVPPAAMMGAEVRAANDPARAGLFDRLAQLIGTRLAAVLFEFLPPRRTLRL